MTVERAIELLQHAQTFIDGCNYGEIKIALDIAIDALKMQNGLVGTYVGTPIVFCKDCAEYDSTYHRCKLLSEVPDAFSCGHNVNMEPNDFCSYGSAIYD